MLYALKKSISNAEDIYTIVKSMLTTIYISRLCLGACEVLRPKIHHDQAYQRIFVSYYYYILIDYTTYYIKPRGGTESNKIYQYTSGVIIGRA